VAPSDGPILEIGSYYGYNCFALSLLGYTVHAVDLPEVVNEKEIQTNYSKYNIPLKPYKAGPGHSIPAADTTYAGAMIIEVLEHLSTNPLFLFSELERVMKPGGWIVLTTPNQVRLRGRVKVLLGRSINDDCRLLLKGFNPDSGFKDAGYHWKIYTLNEVCTLATAVGLEIIDSRYVWEPRQPSGTILDLMVRSIERVAGFLVPSCRNWLYFKMQKKEN